MDFIITKVDPGSIAEKYNINQDDILIYINGHELTDHIDYEYYMGESKLCLTLKNNSGEIREVNIKKYEGEDIGLSFLMSGLEDKKHCRNKCLFCFVDQLPCGMRDTLYFKDDDWRFSFLMGNYITLTNISDEEFDRIIAKKISPLYISVHAADSETRKKLLTNKNAGGIIEKIKMLTDNGIVIHPQIVMCPGINDGEILKDTIDKLYAMYPGVRSLAVVPAGLTAHRDGLHDISPVTKTDAQKAIDIIEKYTNKIYEEHDEHFVYASDEMYIRAQRKLPDFYAYDDFPQIENGVGLIAKFFDEAEYAFDDFCKAKYKQISIATGVDFEPYMKEIAIMLKKQYNIDVYVYGIKNKYFGESITVAGLLCACDVTEQLKDKPLGECLFLPGTMFREFSDVTLDDSNLNDIMSALNTDCKIADCDGYEFIRSLCEE